MFSLFDRKRILIFVMQIFICSSAIAWMPTAALTQKRLSLVAGSPGIESGIGFLDGVGTNARFGLISYLTIDAQDNLYVVDPTNSAIRKVTPSGVVSTLYAGNGAADGTGWAARFGSSMQGITIDSSKNLYVVDTGNNSIRKITPSGVVTTLAGPLSSVTGSADGTGAAARFYMPYQITIDLSSGNLFVADTSNHSIRKITSGGAVTTLAGTSGSWGSADGTGAAARFKSPKGIGITSTGDLIVADTGNHTIRKINSSGVVTTIAGLAGTSGIADGTGTAARFNSPLSVAVDSGDNIWVGDNGGTIRKVTLAGVVTTFAGNPNTFGAVDGNGSNAQFRYPSGMIFDSAGNLFVADAFNGTIRKVSTSADVTTFAGAPLIASTIDGTGNGAMFTNPSDIAIDTSDNIYVVESSSNCIRKITPAGVVTTFAGHPGLSGSADGTGTAATFNNPNGIGIDSSGNLLVADTGNQVIRKITPAGVVTTYAGTSGVSGSADGTLASAKFYGPFGLTVSSGDITYVSDLSANSIRKIAAGAVTTFAGKYGTSGSTDATGASARFTSPRGLAVDNTNGNVYVADYNNNNIRKITPAGVVTTLAGLWGAQAGTDGTGSAARFNLPRGVAVDSSGNVYVADGGGNTIRKITSGGVVTTVAGTYNTGRDDDGNGTMAGFKTPVSVKFDSSGNLFIATSSGNNIRKMTPAGDVTHFAGYQTTRTGYTDGTALAARFNGPRSMTMDSSKNLYVVDAGNSAIRKITPAGVVSNFAGMPGLLGSANGTGTAGQFNAPNGIVRDSSGNFFISDSGNKTIRKITAAGAVSLFAGTPGMTGSTDGSAGSATFNSPGPMAIDSSDNIYLVETAAQTIRKITPAGVVSTIAGTYNTTGSADGTGAAARFTTPVAITIDTSNNLYVVDQSNSAIRKITPGGVVTTFAGTKGTQGFLDGALGVAKFSTPTGITIDKAGYLYVADTNNNAIRKIDPSGNVSTVVGGVNTVALSYRSLPASLSRPAYLYTNGGKLYITAQDAIVVVPNP